MSYYVQGLYSNGVISNEEEHAEALAAAKAARLLANAPTFEGATVRVLTEDGEALAWEALA